MSEPAVYSLHEGSGPLLISVPHAGRELPEAIAANMTAAARIQPDTDWHVARLYEFSVARGATLLVANYSRYVVDLNRSLQDESLYPGSFSTGLCPERTFAGGAVYADGQSVGEAERQRRIERYWQPYHHALATQLGKLRAQHGYTLLWDAHSIASRVPRLFAGELPELNIGTDDGRSCPPSVTDVVVAAAAASPYNVVANERFRGGFITRHYGAPASRCYAIQLELAQRSYMLEHSLSYDSARAATLIETLKTLLQAYLTAAAEHNVKE